MQVKMYFFQKLHKNIVMDCMSNTRCLANGRFETLWDGETSINL